MRKGRRSEVGRIAGWAAGGEYQKMLALDGDVKRKVAFDRADSPPEWIDRMLTSK